MRLDKFIADNTQYSRADVRKLIKHSRVRVNGSNIIKVNNDVCESDHVFIDDQRVNQIGAVYILFHKPAGVVCATHDAEHPTVIDLLTQRETSNESLFNGIALHELDLQIAGRLDKDTTGLVLLTNDGDWNHRVTSPNFFCPKRYYVQTRDPIDPKLIQIFNDGILLKNETKPTKPAKLNILASNEAFLTLAEGKYHQVKRMFAANGNEVTKLHREAIGSIELPRDLAEGHYIQISHLKAESIFQPSNSNLLCAHNT